MQYRESDLAFLKRLLAEEGLFYWFEHKAADGDILGSHTLVIADRNGAFAPNPQAGATLGEDSFDQWHGLHQIDTTDSHASSRDYRSLSSRPQSTASASAIAIAIANGQRPTANGQLPRTAAWHDPVTPGSNSPLRDNRWAEKSTRSR